MENKEEMNVQNEQVDEVETLSTKKPFKSKIFIILICILSAIIIVMGYFIYNLSSNNTISSDYKNELIPAKVGEKWGFINKENEIVINPQFDEISDYYSSTKDLIPVKLENKWGYINTKGKYVINPQFEEASVFDKGLAYVKSNEKYGYINTKGEYVINPQFEEASSFSKNGLAYVKSDNKYGFINKKGEYVINPQFIYATSFYDDDYAIVVKTNKKYIMINKNGEQISSEYNGLSFCDYKFCKKSDCYNWVFDDDDDYCYEHEDEDSESRTSSRYCKAYGCLNNARFGCDYCEEHSYLEDD